MLFFGEEGLRAATAQSRQFDHYTLHSDDGQQAIYEGPVTIDERAWLSAAPDTEPRLVALTLDTCELADETILSGVLHLAVDGIRVEGFTVVGARFCRAITTWPSTAPTDGTQGHEIVRMNIAALLPEHDGRNNIQSSLGLSANATVAFSHFYGYWEDIGDLSQAHGSLIAHNTFAFYQESGKTSADTVPASISSVEGVDGLQILNNVFIALPVARTPLVQGNAATRNFAMRGNVFYGFSRADVTDVGVNTDSASGLGNNIEESPDLQTPLLSPYRPQFLRTNRPMVSDSLRLSGRSIDGIEVTRGRLEDETPALPGAFQMMSDATAPITVVRLGPTGCRVPEQCTLSADVDNEMQVAVWSLWPGGTLQIAPGTYAGNAVVSWPISIMGDRTDLVVLRAATEDELWRRTELWWHGAVVAITREAHESSRLEQVTIEPAPSASIPNGILVEGPQPEDLRLYSGRPRVENVIIRRNDADAAELQSAFVVGTRSWVQDALVVGPWQSCVELGSIVGSLRTDAALINMTCRLTGPGPAARRGAIEVNGAVNAHFVNWVVQAESGGNVALFHKVGGEGIVSFTARSMYYRGMGAGLATGFPFVQEDRFVFEDVAALNASPFVSATNSRLADGSPGIDDGVDPSTIQFLETLYMGGRGLDGNIRNRATIDRGAYERAP